MLHRHLAEATDAHDDDRAAAPDRDVQPGEPSRVTFLCLRGCGRVSRTPYGVRFALRLNLL